MSSLFNDLQNRGWKKLLLCFGYISFAILSLGMPSIEQKRNNNNLMIARTTDFWAKTTFIRADRKPIKNFTFRMAKKCLSLKKTRYWSRLGQVRVS